MSTTVYLIRHGESQANRRDVFLGHYNMSLTDTGRKQAELTAAYLFDAAPTPAAIYSSDLTRAHETAECTAVRLGMPIVKDERLREIDAGRWDNKSFTELKTEFAESFVVWTHDIGSARCDGGESVAEVQSRFVAAVADLAARHDGETVFIFSHATPVRTFAAHCLGKTSAEMKEVPWPPNASVTEAVYENGAFRLVEYARHDFMGDMVTSIISGCVKGKR